MPSQQLLKSIGRVIVHFAVGGIATVATYFFLVLNNAAGHGSALPAHMFEAPGGFGFLVWPLAFTLCGLPRKWSPAVFVAVAVLITLHNVSAWGVYNANNEAERSNMLGLASHNSTMRWMINIDLTIAYTVQVFLIIYSGFRAVAWLARPLPPKTPSKTPESRT